MTAFQHHLFLHGPLRNYGHLIHDPASGETAMVDAGDADAALAALKQTGWTLTQLWVTHHHADHTAGIQKVKAETGCTVHGPVSAGTDIAGIDKHQGDGDKFQFAARDVVVLHTPGHTLDMINFHVPEEQFVATGDTLFVLGCGRMFEGDAAMFEASLSRLAALPGATRVYCGHEYTASNLDFALSVDPQNTALLNRAIEIREQLANNQPTVPSTIADECAANPFMRCREPLFKKALGMDDADHEAVFAHLRAQKDAF